jgi:hypothetical protein
MTIKGLTFIFILCLAIYAHGQQLAIKELPYLLYNGSVMEELYQIKGSVKSVQTTVTEFQSVAAVNSVNKKQTYTIHVTVDGELKAITEISDKHKPSFRIRTVYTYGDNNKITTKKVYDDNLDGKGWQFNEEFLYSYEKDKFGHYCKELVKSVDPRFDTAAPTVRHVKARYNENNQLISYSEVGYTYKYQYNEQGDITLEKTDGGTEDTRGERVYKYTYDSKGNWIRRETYRTFPFMPNLVLEQISTRIIIY